MTDTAIITASQRLYFRAINTGDRDDLFRIYSDKEAMQYRGSKHLEHIEDADAMIAKTLRDYSSGGECRWAIVEKDSELLIGSFLYKTISETACEIGYSIGRNFWGQGYAQEALNQMLVYLKQMGYSQIVATTKTDNTASSRILEKAGFSLVLRNYLDASLEFEKKI